MRVTSIRASQVVQQTLKSAGGTRALQPNVSSLLQGKEVNREAVVNGWVRSVRKQKKVAFAGIGDGSTIHPLQAVLKPEDATHISTGTAVRLHGVWQPSRGNEQSHELQVSKVEILGDNDPEHNPLQTKYQTPEFLRTISHLRARIPANTLLLRLRSKVIRSLTQYFDDNGFVQTHTPIITSSDCEGAGEVFTLASNPAETAAKESPADKEAHANHFFRQPKYLTVSAQLHLEALAQAVNKVWTLSPTFRAEKSDTQRHLSEFYMLEAETCFTEDLNDVMDVVENMLRSVAKDLSSSPQDTLFEEIMKRDRNEQTLRARWTGMASEQWPRITYTEAIKELEKAHAQHNFAFAPSYENGLQAEHERYIATSIGQDKPVFVTDYPVKQKPFYMLPSNASQNSRGTDDTVACFDLLVPELCELVGGSLREHRSQPLAAAMQAKNVSGSNLEWYQDLRKYGTVPHGGFGLGFDRLLCYLSGCSNVRDIVAFPRWYQRADC